jgi:hypothetical protein
VERAVDYADFADSIRVIRFIRGYNVRLMTLYCIAEQ